MANKGKSNKLKRKRGKKFRYFEGEDKDTPKTGKVAVQTNPFEDHHTSKKA